VRKHRRSRNYALEVSLADEEGRLVVSLWMDANKLTVFDVNENHIQKS
jgi:hypothetical protein